MKSWTDFWTMVTDFLTATGLDKLVGLVLIVIVAVIARAIAIAVIHRVVNRVISGVKKRENVEDTQELAASPLRAARIVQRSRALGGVLSSVVTTLIVIVAVLLAITTVAPGAAGAFSLITAALGAGLGFGAQNVVKDVLNGLFIVAEDQIGVGDVIDSGYATGVVEHVGIRITQIRDVNGTLWYVRNGEMQRVGNMSQGWARVLLDLAVPYDADVEAVKARILEAAEKMAGEAKWRRLIIEKPEIWGIESISAEAVVVRLVVKTRTGVKDDVARELRARLKAALDAMGVRLPALNQISLAAPAPISGAKPAGDAAGSE